MGVMNWLFGCRHQELSRAFTTDDETYKVCLKCGKHLRYSWQTMSLVSEKEGRKTSNKPPPNRVTGDTKRPDQPSR